MISNIILSTLIIVLLMLLIRSNKINKKINVEKNDLIALREVALDISDKVLHVESEENHFQYILESCMSLLPKSKYGSILMFNEDGLLVPKAYIGFDEEEIKDFKLPLEESFLYIASGGKIEKTMIINSLKDIIIEKNIVSSVSDDQDFALRSEVSAPLFNDDALVGMLCIDGDVDNIFTDKDIHILDYISGQISNVINKQELYNEILTLSRYDSLTSLLNRDYFDKIVKVKISDAEVNNKELHLVITDLNGLKPVNDNFGHSVGDQLIKVFSQELEKVISEYGMCARYGGDEFIAYLEEVNLDEIINLMNLLKSRLDKIKLDIKNVDLSPEFSYGIANMIESDYSFNIAYKIADERMYNYKVTQNKILKKTKKA